MSRLLGQIRAEVGDPIFVRTGRQLVPTPRAEAMRLALRNLASDVERVLDRNYDLPAAEQNEHRGSKPLSRRSPPLGIRPSVLLDGQPTPVEFAKDLAELANTSDPRRRLAGYLALMGRGIGNSRPLTQAEADDGFEIILNGQADPLQIGAFLLLMHYRRETAPELAGMVSAARRFSQTAGPSPDGVDLDWPAYLPRQSPRPPWFLQAARLVANAGYRVLLHGPTTDAASSLTELGLEKLGIRKCSSPSDVRKQLKSDGIAFLSLRSLGAQLQNLLDLYPVFESRTPIHSVVHMLNPLGADAILAGVARITYHGMHRDAAHLLQWPGMSVLASARDVAEFNPFKTAKIYRLCDGISDEVILPMQNEIRSPPRSVYSVMENWEAVWAGAERDARAVEVVVNTAAVALLTIRKQGADDYPRALEEARLLWQERFS